MSIARLFAIVTISNASGPILSALQSERAIKKIAPTLSALATVFVTVSTQAQTFKTIYNFNGTPDGEFPVGLIYQGHTLFGATSYGGEYGYGTVFRLDPSTGNERILHSFGGTSDGVDPVGELLFEHGILYGATIGGGAGPSNGTVFAIEASTGSETVLHSFTGSDGFEPNGSLIEWNNTLFGTTFSGSGPKGDDATAFSLNPNTGSETILYTFNSRGHGDHPGAGLTYNDGKLYGTTEYLGFHHGSGTVFRIDIKTNKLSVLYVFRGGVDGLLPEGGLTYQSGSLFGTTLLGGVGYGVVFRIDPATHTETTLYSFKGSPDASEPSTSLIYVNGLLYGTTPYGGEYGLGTIYSVNPSTGTEAVLYSFPSWAAGVYPQSSLTYADGSFYGTTSEGGEANQGTVFELTP